MAPTSNHDIYGLVLAGGRSARMGKDKAGLRYGGRTQLENALDLAKNVCAKVFLSLRKGQPAPMEAENTEVNLTILRDRWENIGPLGGIITALEKHPDHPWLGMAVDLPFLDANTLAHLITNRNRKRPFTAYRSNFDGLPEPLCALYEPMALSILHQFSTEKQMHCPRKIMMRSNTRLLALPHERALDNINTPDDYREALQILKTSIKS